MSIYVMTVGELAKKRGEPVGEFVKKVQEVGFEAGSHAKKLTQADLDVLIGLLDGTANVTKQETEEKVQRNLNNPNVLFVNRQDGKKEVIVVEVSLSDTGSLELEVVEQHVEDSFGEGLLEFRKQLGMKLGVN